MSSAVKRTRKAEENVLSIYFKEISRIPLLSRAEEDALARRAMRGDRLAGEKLIKANLRFVVNLAKKFPSYGIPLEDLVSEGNIGLVLALEHFDPGKGYRFISYAVWWIRQTILRAIGEKSRMIRLPQNKAQELLQVTRVRDELQGEHSRTAVEQEIAQRLHKDRARVAELLTISRDLLSLDAPVSADEDFSPLEDFVEDKSRGSVEDILTRSSLRDDIETVLTSLSQRESEVLQCRYGLNGRKPMSLREIGRRCKLTKERIRQIEKTAIKRLRHPSSSHVLRAYT